MERRKGIGKVSTGKRNVPVSEPVDGARSVVPVPVKPFVPKSPSSTSISSSFNPSQPLPESAEVREYNVRVPKYVKFNSKPISIFFYNIHVFFNL